MQRLTYKKITDSIIEIDLQNGYTIAAIIVQNKKENNYLVSLYLTDSEMTLYDLMGDFEKMKFEKATDKNIFSAILREVSFLFTNKLFDKYFDRYKYMNDCFARGDELFTEENKKNGAN